MNSVYKLSVIGRDVMISGSYGARHDNVSYVSYSLCKLKRERYRERGGKGQKPRGLLCLY